MNRLSLLLGTAAVLSGVACSDLPAPAGVASERPEKAAPPVESPPLPQGAYDVQSVSYDDASGAYRVFLLAPPPGAAPLFQTTTLRMARLSDEDIAAGKKSQLVVDAEGPTATLTPDFQIAYTHNVTEERGGEVVVVRQETSSWSPFMAGMTGAMVGNMLFSPRYYYPPPYVSGGRLAGIGGSGATAQLAAGDYAQKNGTPHKSTVLSKSGYSKAPASGLKSTGSGAGSSRFKTTKPTSPTRRMPFGGGRGGFGRRR